MTNRKSEVSFDFAFVEDRILRAKRLLRKLVRVNRRNAAVKAKAFDCGIGQIIPRTDAFIGQMIDFPSAGFYPRQKLKNAFGEISGRLSAKSRIFLTKSSPKEENSHAVRNTRQVSAFSSTARSPCSLATP